MIKVFCSFFFLSASCSGVFAQSDSSLTIPMGDTFGFSHPYFATNHGAGIYHFTSESLFQIDSKNGKVQPWLVERYESDVSGKNWKFTLRSGLKWSDNETLNTDDIRYTIEKILSDTSFRSPIAISLRAQVESISVENEVTFSVKLRKPNKRFPHSVLANGREGQFYILPEHIWTISIGDLDNDPNIPGILERALGSGPYVIKNRNLDELLLERNSDWWGSTEDFQELPLPKKVILKYVASDGAEIDDLKADLLDVGSEFSLKTFEEIQSENPFVIAWGRSTPVAWPGYCPRQLDFNTLESPWDKATLRKAVANFIDQKRVISEAFDGENYPSPSIFSESAALGPYVNRIVTDGHAMFETSDPTAGDTLLIGAGYVKNDNAIYQKDGNELTLEIQVADEPSTDNVAADIVAKTLSDAGIKTTVKVVAADELWAWVMPPGKFQAVYSWLGCGSTHDPYASLLRYHPKYAVDIGIRSPGYNNMARWNTKAAEDYGLLVDEIEKITPGDPDLIELVSKAYALIAEEVPFIPIVQEPRIIPFSTSRWEGWPSADEPYAMPMVFWGQFHQIVHNLRPASPGKE